MVFGLQVMINFYELRLGMVLLECGIFELG